MVCGSALFCWTGLGICLYNTPSLAGGNFRWYWHLCWTGSLLLTGCLTFLRDRGKSPSWAAAKAALLGFVPEVLALALWASGILHPLVTNAASPYPLLESLPALFDMTFPTTPTPGFEIIPVVIAAVLIYACLIGFSGGLLARALPCVESRRRTRRG